MGRFGQALGEELQARRVEVLAVDADQRRVQELADDFDHIVCADTTQPSTLRQLGVADAKRVVIAIGSDLEASILTASAVIDLGVPSVWAKADSPAHEKILRQIGVHHIVMPEADTGRRVAHLMDGQVADFIEFDPGFALAKMVVPKHAAGKTSREIRAQGAGVAVVAVRRDGGAYTLPSPQEPLLSGDLVVMAGAADDLEEFAAG
ncbi:TrkA family potassium uptake protein [Corynebacterium poyangense]|uniref:TrkA family potassium uptake protein n=2 Tax=Corynebacterium poyangense TaxID=2684405 RepID=A0A7H0SSG6_9CORY|nr:TrkA family potassium uptake protein [Corynebacterium poyangense]QNQ91491.1 TrkA family potassium uptake protein [Corynebacterium poyangense]